MLKPKSIRTKLVLLYLAVAVPLAAALSLNAFHRYEHQIDNIYRQREDLAVLTATNLSGFVKGVAIVLETAGHAISQANMSAESKNHYLSELTRDNPAVVDIAFADTKGIITAAEKPGSVGSSVLAHAHFREVLAGKRLSVSDYEPDLNGKSGFSISTAIIENGRLRGVMMAVVDVQKLESLIPALATGCSNIVDSKGILIYQSQHPDLDDADRDWSNIDVITDALKGDTARTDEFVCPKDKKRHFMVEVPIEELGWAAGSGIDTDEALASVRDELFRIRTLSLVMFLLAIALSFVVSRAISKPIVSLSKQAHRIGEECFDEPIVLQSGDELELLARELDGARAKLLASFKSINLLLDASTSLTRSLDIGIVASTLSEILLELLTIDRVAIAAYDEACDEILVLNSPHTLCASAGERFPLRNMPPIFGTLYEAKTLIVVDSGDPALDARDRDFFDTCGVRNIILHPLLVGERMIGHIALGNAASRLRFTSSDLRLLEGIAAQAAVAIENARLFEREHDIAETLQQALLTVPNKLPGMTVDHVYEGALGAYRVGGDFFDVFEIECGRIGFMIGDVSGKGLEAATITAAVKTTIRSFAYQGLTVSEVMQKTNDAMCRQLGKSLFVTAIFGVINSESGAFDLVSAGHPDAIVCRNGACRSLIPPRNVPIGAFPGVSFDGMEGLLSNSDALILYTDGLIEARADGELYGEARVIAEIVRLEAAAPQELLRELVDSARAFTGGTLADDVAILMLRLDGSKSAPST